MSTVESEVGAEPSLSSILSGKDDAPSAPVTESSKPAETAPAATPEPQAQSAAETSGQPRGDDGKFKPKSETAATPETKPAAEQPQAAKPKVDVSALIAERRKRQAAEAETRAAQQAPKPDFFENPDKAIEDRIAAHETRLKGQLFRLSEKAARTAHREDYDTVAQAFADAAERDPRLIDALQADDDPGELIYTLGKHIIELADVGGDLGLYREKVSTELKGQLSERDTKIKTLEGEIAELKKQYETLSTVKGSLNTRTSAA
jgi:hypothetical protein